MISMPGRRGLALPYMGRRGFFLVLTLFFFVVLWLYNAVPQTRPHIFDVPVGPSITSITTTTIAGGPDNAEQSGGSGGGSGPLAPGILDLTAYPYGADSNLTVNLVVATTAQDDISWTSRLRIPNLKIVRYVSDNMSAEYHPPVPRGREALMYQTYLHDFYDDLPDVSILIHPDERPWHTDAELWSSMLFTLSNLDLEEVVRRGYANLRVSWYQACPGWINTTKTVEESAKAEEPWAAEVFLTTFAVDAAGEPVDPRDPRNVVAVPEVLGGACCSQLAVSRAAVRSRPRAHYARAARWLAETPWPDSITGRVWERLWPWLFLGRAVDCPVEWKTYCRLYGVCFRGGAPDLAAFRQMYAERAALRDRAAAFWPALLRPWAARADRERLDDLTLLLDARLRAAMDHGREEKARLRAEGTSPASDGLGDLYQEL